MTLPAPDAGAPDAEPQGPAPAGPVQDPPGAGADPFAEPTERVTPRWTAALSLANGSVWVGWYGPIQVLLALQAAELAPAGWSKESVLAWVTGIGAAVSLVANPLFGALSDRTVSRFGRRTPWVVAGVLGGAAGLVLLALARDVTTMVLGWCVVQLALNATFAAVVAAVPDRVPVRQRGGVGGWLGVSQTLGIVLGTGLAMAAGGITAGYLACALFTVLAVAPYVLLRQDTPLPAARRPPFSWRGFAAGFWIDPRVHRDFGWAWLTRFLINLGNALALLYLLYYFRDVLYAGDGEKAASGVLVVTALNAVLLLATVVVGGVWSDRVGRRKPFVLWAGVVMAFAAGIMAFWQSWTGVLVAAALLGIGFGVFTSVDFALMADVLPAAAHRGKDLGVINIANSLPQVAAPALAAPLVNHLGGYPVLYLVSAGVGLLGAVLVGRIRGVA
ncbi:MFS transporter [Streptomyces iconiensis]|uniref:MFS transporter n=1 Tax=Streptomyces iconiensis TaxID=1384038 RepID=A0ABT6ZN20_9ACTN|nr:MFS transporter [Streptomyces iconiensis]MDJ1130450.1 MFS transporter [Streptomyces iconiensis]